MFLGRKSGVMGTVVAGALGVSVLVAPTASAAHPKVKLPDRIKATTRFPVSVPIEVKNDATEMRIEWGNSNE